MCIRDSPEGEEYAVDVLYTDYASDFNKINTDAIVDSVNAAKALQPDVIVAMLDVYKRQAREGRRMDIKQAKEEIRRAVLAYTERTPDGALCMPCLLYTSRCV